MGSDTFRIGDVEVGVDAEFFVIAGPCVIEDEAMCIEIAEKLKGISAEVGVPILFKASFDKANRSSIEGFRGPGMKKGLKILDTVRRKTSLAVITDVHEPAQAEAVGEVVDCVQVPAFLCRQTDLLAACARTGKAVNVKKGQFVSPEEMGNVVDKIRASGNDKVLLTERGTFFGYKRLVNDMTCIEVMKRLGCPVVFDATHSTQQPGGLGDASAGNRQLAPILAKAAVAAGANGLFIEVHTEPEKAKCDAECVLPIEWVGPLVAMCKQIFDTVRKGQ